MDIKGFLLCLILLIVGIIVMLRNRFYKNESDGFLYVSELKLFLGGLLATLIGAAGLIDAIIKLLKQ